MEINIFQQAVTDYSCILSTAGAGPNPDDTTITWAAYINDIIQNVQTVTSIYFPNLGLPYDMKGSLYINRSVYLHGEPGASLRFSSSLITSYVTAFDGSLLANDTSLARVALFVEAGVSGFRIDTLTIESDQTAGSETEPPTLQTPPLHGIWAKSAFIAEKINVYAFSGVGIWTDAGRWQIAFSFISGCGRDGFSTSGSGGTALYLHTSYCGRENRIPNITPVPGIYYGIRDVSEGGNTFVGCHSATNNNTGSFLSENNSIWIAAYTEDLDPQPVINNGSLWLNQERSVPTGSGTIWTGNSIWMNEGHDGIKFINNINPQEQVTFTAGSSVANTIFEFGAAKDVIVSALAPMLGDINGEIDQVKRLLPTNLQKIAVQYPILYSYIKLVQTQAILQHQRAATTDTILQKQIDTAIADFERQKEQTATTNDFVTEQDNITTIQTLMLGLLSNTVKLTSLREQKSNTTDPNVLADLLISISKTEILIKDYFVQIQGMGIEPYEWAFLNTGVWRLRFDPNELANATWYKLVYNNNALSHVAPAILFSSGLTPATEADSGSIAFPRGFYLGGAKIKISSSNQQPIGATRVGSVVFNTNPGLGVGGWVYVGATEGWKPFNLFE